MEQNNVTAEEFKIKVLKQRISQIVGDYEERIADYEVRLQVVKQRTEELEGQLEYFKTSKEATGETETAD